ncbi:MAG: glycoside hydrolase family 76 protein [Phycisphaerae bacterium]
MHKLVLFLFAASLLTSQAISADFSQFGRETLRVIERDHSMAPRAGYFEDQTKSAPAFTWSTSMLLLAYSKAAAFDDAYYKPLDELISFMDLYWGDYKGIGGYDHQPHPKAVTERYYDDNAWVAMGLIDAYEATGKKEYLGKARETIKFCLSGIDHEKGGVWWREYWERRSRRTKNTCSVAPIAFACLRYYQFTNSTPYLKAATELMDWLDANLKDGDALYWDNVRLDGEIDKKKWTYNSAMPVRNYILLSKFTGKNEYLDKATATAKAARDFWFVNETGEIKCEAMFAFTLTEAWVELSAATGDPQWRKLAEKTLSYVNDNLKDENGRYSSHWYGKTDGSIEKWKLLYPAATARGYWALAGKQD